MWAREMPVVGGGTVTECAHNTDQQRHRSTATPVTSDTEHQCRAVAITAGDGVHLGCNTFLAASNHRHETVERAGVGACKVAACRHNDDYQCAAAQIAVGHGDPVYHAACCLSRQPRMLPDVAGRTGQAQRRA